MKKLLFIFNPHAGKGQSRANLTLMLETFAHAGYRTTIHFTRSHEDATRTAAEIGAHFDRVVCCGGDGTLSETVTGLIELPSPPVLGYVPAGTTNDSARNFSIPKGMDKAAATAAFGVPRPYDIGRFNGRPFAYVAAFGAFTQVAYDTPQELKSRFGHLSYVIAGAASLTSIQPYTLKVEYDGGVLTGNFIYGMVSNTYSVGGFSLFPDDQVQLDDGKHEVMLVREGKSLADLHRLLQSLIQKTPVDKSTVEVFHTSRLSIVSKQPVPWTLDGEFGGVHSEVDIVNCRRAISVACGA